MKGGDTDFYSTFLICLKNSKKNVTILWNAIEINVRHSAGRVVKHPNVPMYNAN
jgi:hypothetical protein